LEVLSGIKDQYGERVKKVQSGEGIDWKGLHHAFRVSMEFKEILLTGDLIFPLKDAPWLKEVKYGKYNYINDGLGEKLEDLLNEVTDLCNKSNLPEKPDKDWAEQFILDIYDYEMEVRVLSKQIESLNIATEELRKNSL
jgi:hypothetical protein